MKKINMNRLAAVLLVLVLLTSCFVGSTMARYATGAEGSDTAKAAAFGIKIEASGSVFGKNYLRADNNSIAGSGDFTVSSNDQDKNVVAPGTKGNVLTFKIDGSTEVAVNVTITLDNNDNLQMITLPVHDDYVNYTVYDMQTGDYTKFNQKDKPYNPIVWTLKKTGVTDPVKTGTLEDINTYLGTLSGEYAPNSSEFANICGTYTLSWEWPIGTADVNPADTYLGMVAADKADNLEGKVKVVESFNFKIYIEQVD